MWGLQLESKDYLSVVFTMWYVNPWLVCQSENGDAMFSRHFDCRKCEENIGEAVEQEEALCNVVETVENLHILVTGWVQVENVRLLSLLEQDVGGLC